MEEIADEQPPPPPLNTPLLKNTELSDTLDFSKIFFKFEGNGPTGTQKDRISYAHVMNARDLGFSKIAVATCGNYGASLSYYANKARFSTYVLIPKDYSNSRSREIESYGSNVLLMPGKYEDSVEFLHRNAKSLGWYDASPGSEYSSLDLRAYSNIAKEIVEQLGHAPAYVAVPVGNGTTFAGIYLGFKKMQLNGDIDILPRMIASSTSSGNPIISSFSAGLRDLIELPPEAIIESYVNEPLVSYRSYDGQLALNGLYDTNGIAVPVSDHNMIRYAQIIRERIGINVLPASASALAAVSMGLSRMDKEDECVVVLTGRDNNGNSHSTF